MVLNSHFFWAFSLTPSASLKNVRAVRSRARTCEKYNQNRTEISQKYPEYPGYYANLSLFKGGKWWEMGLRKQLMQRSHRRRLFGRHTQPRPAMPPQLVQQLGGGRIELRP